MRLSADERKAQIAAAATRAFAKHGYRGATTRAIAAEAGVAEALLYRHFDNKEALFVHVVEHTCERIVEGTQRLLAENTDDPGAALASVLEFARALLQRNPTLAKMIFIVNAELDDPVIRDAYVPYQDRVIALLTDALADWQSAGRVAKHIPPRAGAWLIMGTFEVLALMALTGRTHELDEHPSIAIVRRVVGATG